MSDHSTAKEIKLPNYNNVLACDGFIQIHFAPDRPIMESELSHIYHVKHEDQDIYMQLVDLHRVPFSKIQTIMTFPATGLDNDEWRAWWMEKYPKTTPDTEMCVYYYKKKKETAHSIL